MAVRDFEASHLKIALADARGQRGCPEAGKVFVNTGFGCSRYAQATAVPVMYQEYGQGCRLKVQVVESIDQSFATDFVGGLFGWSDRCF